MKILVIDNGLNTEFARVLGKSNLFESVSYFAPWQIDFAATRERAVGVGFDEFDRIYDISEEILGDYDAFAFPDLYWKGLAAHLAYDLERPVWASFEAEELELSRSHLVEAMESVGMDTPSHKVVKGVDRALAAAQDGDFIKIPGYARGDLETAKHQRIMPVWAREMRKRLGPLADTIPIIVEKPIVDDHEVGWDAIFVRGEALWPMMLGYEDKDNGYVSTLIVDFPKPLRDGSRKLLALMRSYGDYTQFLSTEFRGPFLIDITTRAPSPPSDVHLGYWQNFASIVFDYFAGFEPKALRPAAAHAVEVIIKNNEPGDWVWLDVPPALRDNVGVRRGFVHKGLIWSAPQRDESMHEIGAIWACGDSPEQARDELRRIIEEIEMSSSLDVDMNVFDGLFHKIEKGAAHGIDF